MPSIIPAFLLALCDHPTSPACTFLPLISISVHARFTLQLQQSGISLPSTAGSSQTLNTFRKHLKTHLFQSAKVKCQSELKLAFSYYCGVVVVSVWCARLWTKVGGTRGSPCRQSVVQGGPAKVRPTCIFAGNIILVTFKCIGKIQCFLANVLTV